MVGVAVVEARFSTTEAVAEAIAEAVMVVIPERTAVSDSAGEIAELVEPVVPSTSPLSKPASEAGREGPGTGVADTIGIARMARIKSPALLEAAWYIMVEEHRILIIDQTQGTKFSGEKERTSS